MHECRPNRYQLNSKPSRNKAINNTIRRSRCHLTVRQRAKKKHSFHETGMSLLTGSKEGAEQLRSASFFCPFSRSATMACHVMKKIRYTIPNLVFAHHLPVEGVQPCQKS